ncbi:MAG: SHOCT domain-containing protein [Desulfobulbaceae bacterium]|nr:SHOCT domain-containing protein [Desulfobulbaceae bacterium]
MMHWFGNYGMDMGFGWVFMILFCGMIIFIAISLWKKYDSGGKETADEILKKRYARGEISKEEFERMKKDIKE